MDALVNIPPPAALNSPARLSSVFTMNDPKESDYIGWLTNLQQTNPIPFKYEPDDPNYDYRMAKTFGVEPQMYYDGIPHWDSRFKTDRHPNRYVDGVDTKTGRKI